MSLIVPVSCRQKSDQCDEFRLPPDAFLELYILANPRAIGSWSLFNDGLYQGLQAPIVMWQGARNPASNLSGITSSQNSASRYGHID